MVSDPSRSAADPDMDILSIVAFAVLDSFKYGIVGVPASRDLEDFTDSVPMD